MSTSILDLIAQLESQIDESPRPKIGGGNKRVVDTAALFDIISDLRVTIPEEVRWAQSVLADKEAILQNAQEEANQILEQAKEERGRLVDQEEILTEARKRAESMLRRARENSDIVVSGARNYTDDILFDLQRYMREYIEIIDKNREELHVAYTPRTDLGDEFTGQPAAADGTGEEEFYDTNGELDDDRE